MSDQVDVMASNNAASGTTDGSHMTNIQPSGISGGVIQNINNQNGVNQTLVGTGGIWASSTGNVHTVAPFDTVQNSAFCMPFPFEKNLPIKAGVATPNFSVADEIIGVKLRVTELFPHKYMSFGVPQAGFPKISVNVVTSDNGKKIGFAVYDGSTYNLICQGLVALTVATGIYTITLDNFLPDPADEYLFCFTSDSTVVVLDYIDPTEVLIANFNFAPQTFYFIATAAGASGVFPPNVIALNPTADLVPCGLLHF